MSRNDDYTTGNLLNFSYHQNYHWYTYFTLWPLFYGWGSTASGLEPLRGGSLLFTTKFPEIPGIDLSRQTNRNIPQQINFVGKLEKDGGVAVFFIAEKQQKTILNFSLDSLIVTE